MKIIYSGFDTIEFAVKGVLETKVLRDLETAKSLAKKEESAVKVELGANKTNVQVMPNGMTGGYAYVLDTGPLNEQIRYKNSLDANGRNGFVKIRALALATYGWDKAINNALENLSNTGFTTREVSLNRVDYCMDFLNTDFVLTPKHFIAHARVRRSFINETTMQVSHLDKSAVAQSDTWIGVTLGKMPGKQVIIYDKRREVLSKNKRFWFTVWNIDPREVNQTVHRVELRAGKNELKKYNIRSFQDFEKSIGDLFNNTVQTVRYVQPNIEQSNISRLPSHPIWKHVTQHVRTELLAFISNTTPSDILHVIRTQKEQQYLKQAMSHLSGVAVCKGTDTHDIPRVISKAVQDQLDDIIPNTTHPFWKTHKRTSERLCFISPDGELE